jgi:LmbE family N-acetylglucosaminyl deacetylase
MPTVLAVGAHPDDVEMTCAGTLALLKRAGWRVHLASMTAGDMGSATLPPAKISAIRRKEGAASARLLGADYTCLGFLDLAIVYSAESKRRAAALLREVRPELLIVPSPVDYMADHEETPRIFREAAFASTIPNYRTNGKAAKPCERLPIVLYCDPIDNVDHFGRRVTPQAVVDITSVIGLKERMLAAHASQREWLRKQHGEDEYLLWMRRMSADRARDFGRRAVKYAEGFRQHLGHGFGREDVLGAALGKGRVRKLKT